MKTEDAIKSRRSIRKYTSQIPKESEIDKILEAAIWAPSGLNNQPWKFKILKNNEKNKLSEFTHYGNIIKAAPVAICVFLDKDTSYNREKDIMAIGAAIENMLLQAEALGLATCWLGEILNQRENVEALLKIPPTYEFMAAISLGYSDEKPESSRKPLKSFLLD